MSEPNQDLVYVLHIEERVVRIEEIAARGKDKFLESHILQDVVIRNFEVIGEASKQLSDESKSAYPGIPWRRVAGFRDVLIHNYMGVDLEEIWNVIEQALPDLKVSRALLARQDHLRTPVPLSEHLSFLTDPLLSARLASIYQLKSLLEAA